MGRFSDAWAALRGAPPMQRRAAPGVMFGDREIIQAASGLLAGAVPWGVPPQRGEREILVAQRKVPWLHRATTMLAQDFASTDWQLFVPRNAAGQPTKAAFLDRGNHHRRSELRTKAATQQGGRRLNVQEVIDHPLLDLLENPNPYMSGSAFRALFELYLLLSGEFFGVLERNQFGMPVQIWPVPGYWVFRTPYFGSPFFHFNFGTWFVDVPESEVVWIKHLRAENPYWRGAGIGEALGDEIEINAYSAKTAKNTFWNNGTPQSVMTIEGVNDNGIERFKEKLLAEIQGYWNAAKMLILNRKATVQVLGQKFSDIQLLELRKASRDTLIQTFGIPPEMMGILENSNKATITVASYIYAQRILQPALEFARSEFQHRLVPEFDPALLLDYLSPTPEDNEFDLNVAKVAPWAFSKNEMRALGGKPPVADGEAFPPMPTVAPKPDLAPGKGGDPEWTKHLPPRVRAEEEDDKPPLSQGDVEAIASAADADVLAGPMAELMSDELKKWIKSAADTLGVGLDFQLINPKVAEFARVRAADKVKGLGAANETTRQAIRDALGEGLDAGEGIPDLRKRIEEVFDDARGYRATQIARTETTHAAGWGNTTAMRESGVVDRREWVSTRDSRTRDSHREMDGQEVGIREPFRTPSGESGDFPGDFNDPAESVNCRCTTVAVMDEKSKPADRDAAWKSFDDAVTPWEHKANRVLRVAFAKQKTAVLKSLREAAR